MGQPLIITKPTCTWRLRALPSRLYPKLARPAGPRPSKGSAATFRFCRKTPRFRDFAEKPIVDCEALRQGGFRAKPGFSEESNLCNTSLLLAFQVQRNNVLNFCAGFSIGKQAKSLASVAKRYRPVARIWAVDGRRFHVKQYCAP